MRHKTPKEFQALEQPMDNNILGNINDHIDDMLGRHCKVFVFRMDVSIPEDKSNETFSKFQSRMIQQCKRKIGDTAYVAV